MVNLCGKIGDETAPIGEVDVVGANSHGCFRNTIVLTLERPNAIDHECRRQRLESSCEVGRFYIEHEARNVWKARHRAGAPTSDQYVDIRLDA